MRGGRHGRERGLGEELVGRERLEREGPLQYDIAPEGQEESYDAITDNANGVMQWFRSAGNRIYIDAGARFLGEFEKYNPVQNAFWLKESDEGEWSLYVASDKITDDNFDVAYGEVLRIAGEFATPSSTPSS